MNIQITNLLELTAVPNAAGAIYTNSSGQSALLQKVTFTNNGTAGAGVTLEVWWVPSGGARGNSNIALLTTVAPKGPTNDGVYEAICLEGHMLAPGDALHAIAGTATALNVAISGSLIS